MTCGCTLPLPPPAAALAIRALQVLPGEVQQLAACFADRDAAVQQGLLLEGRRYEVSSRAASQF